MLAAVFLFALARLGRGAFGPFGLLATAAKPGFLFGPLPLFVLSQPSVGKRVRTRVTFVFGERAQHDAG